MTKKTQILHRRSFLASAGGLPLAGAAFPAPDEFTALFDGRTLNGWTIEEGSESSFYVDGGAVLAHPSASAPTWLRSNREYENFELRGEFLAQGWNDSGICLHAPKHGRISGSGLQFKIFSLADHPPAPHSMGAIFPVAAPRLINVREGWNDFRILMDWPRLRAWTNGEEIHDLDLASHPVLKYRLRYGHLGITTTSYPCRFRNLRLRELPSREKWTELYQKPEDLAKWYVTAGDPHLEALGQVLRADGQGDFGTRELFRDFELHMYIRGCRQHNGGVQFRCSGEGDQRKVYEIQLHDVEEAHFPTGSLYHFKRALYPRLEPERWFFLQLVVKDRFCLVRINGDSVLEYDALERLEEGRLELQAHSRGRWLEYKHIRIKRI